MKKTMMAKNRAKRLYEKIDLLEERFAEIEFSKGANFIERSRYMVREYVESNSEHADEIFDMIDEKTNWWLRCLEEVIA